MGLGCVVGWQGGAGGSVDFELCCLNGRNLDLGGRYFFQVYDFYDLYDFL